MARSSTGRMGTPRKVDRGLSIGSDIVVRLMGGLAIGGGMAAVIFGGAAVLPGAVLGGLLGVVAPNAANSFAMRRRGRRSNASK